MFFFEAKCDYLLPIINLGKFEPKAGNRFSCDIFMGVLFPYPRIKGITCLKNPVSIVLKVEIPNMGI